MYIQPFFFYGIGIIAVCLVAIILATTLLYFRVLKAFSALKTEFTQYKNENESQAQQALNDATAKAQEIIKGSQFFTNDMKNAILNVLSQSASASKSTYEQILHEVANKSVSELLSFSSDLKGHLSNEATTLTTQLKKEIADEEQGFHQAVQQGEAQVLKQLQIKAAQMLPQVLKESAKRAITKEESEALVLQVLETVKKEHGFT